METIRIDVKWTGIAPLLAELLRSEDRKTRDFAYGELLRLCQFADGVAEREAEDAASEDADETAAIVLADAERDLRPEA